MTKEVDDVGKDEGGAAAGAMHEDAPSPVTPGADPIAELSKEIEKLERREWLQTLAVRLYMGLGVVLAVVVAPALFLVAHERLTALGSLAYGAVFIILASSRPVARVRLRIRDLKNERELLSMAKASPEERADKRFRLHQYELQKYYDQARGQSGTIFYVGLALIGLGFVVILATLSFVFYGGRTRDLSEQIVLGAIGSIGAILTNFVAAIYLKMNARTVKSLADFHNRPVTTHHLHFADFLASQIDPTDARDKVLGEIALTIAQAKP